MDAATLDHFEKWFSNQFNTRLTGRQFLNLRRAMLNTFNSDPAYWDNKDYWSLYDASVVREKLE